MFIYTKLKDKIPSSFFKPFLVCLISSYIHYLLPRFKGCHQELFKYIKSFQRTFGKQKFQFLHLISYLQFNVGHVIYVIKCFPSNVIILVGHPASAGRIPLNRVCPSVLSVLPSFCPSFHKFSRNLLISFLRNLAWCQGPIYSCV